MRILQVVVVEEEVVVAYGMEDDVVVEQVEAGVGRYEIDMNVDAKTNLIIF